MPEEPFYRLPEPVIVLPGIDCEINDCQLPECSQFDISPQARGLARIVMYEVPIDLRVVEAANAADARANTGTIN